MSRKIRVDQMSHESEKQNFAQRKCRVSYANFARVFLSVTFSAFKVVKDATSRVRTCFFVYLKCESVGY